MINHIHFLNDTIYKCRTLHNVIVMPIICVKKSQEMHVKVFVHVLYIFRHRFTNNSMVARYNNIIIIRHYRLF